MKRTTSIFILSLFVLFVSGCGSEKSKEKEGTIKQEKTEKEEKEATIPKKIIDKFGKKLPDGENVFNPEKWEKLGKLCDDIIQYKKKTDGTPDKKKIQKIMKKEGFENFEKCKKDIENIAQLNDFIMSAGMNFTAIKMKKMTGTEDEVKKEEQKFLDKLKTKGYTIDDYKLMDEKKEVISKAFSTLIILSMVTN
jgi:hypothetical protein